MKKYLFTLLLLAIPSLSLAAIADNFIYPTSVWDVGTQHGDEIYGGLYHMGTDACFGPGDGAPVYASASGVVKEVGERSQFGLVILIEHQLYNGSKIVSLYGHLRPSDPQVSVGQSVSVGDLIGYLGNSSENGGWDPHIHFGIHKNPYTGQWVYSGHVPNQSTADSWYDPENYIANHLTEDNWDPEISTDLTNGQIVTSWEIIKAYATDIGSSIDTVELKISQNQKNWTTAASNSGYEDYPHNFYTSLSGYDDGKLYIRLVATDEFGNKAKTTKEVIKKADASITKNFAAMQGSPSSAKVKSYYQNGELHEELTPNKNSWDGSGDIALGDVTGNGTKNIVTVPGPGKKIFVKIYSAKGKKLTSFQAYPDSNTNGARVATGDIDGDGQDEIIVGSGSGKTSKLKVFKKNGTLLWKSNAYQQSHTKGIDVTA